MKWRETGIENEKKKKSFSGRRRWGGAGTTGNDEGKSFFLIGSASLIEFLGLQSAFVVSHAPPSSQTMFTHSDKVIQDYFSLSLFFFLFYLDSHAGRRQPSSWKCIVPSWQLPANSVFFFQKSKLLPWLSPVTAVIIITREKKVSALSFLFFCCHFYLYPIRRCALPRRNQFWFAAATQRSGWLGTAGKKTISFKLV